MTVYEIQSTVFCPLDNGFLKSKKYDFGTLFVCPKCGNRYFTGNIGKVPEGIIASNGFIKPQKFKRKLNERAQKCSVTLKMTIHREYCKKNF